MFFLKQQISNEFAGVYRGIIILKKGTINVHWSLNQCYSHQNVHYDELKLVNILIYNMALRSRRKFHAKIKSIEKYLRFVKYRLHIDK